MSVVHATRPYSQLVVSVADKIGTVKINRPKTLNSLVGEVYTELIAALREMDANPDVVVTVITGEGRFFSSGADVKAGAQRRANEDPAKMTIEDKAVSSMSGLSWALLIGKAMIEHKKLLVFALNGPAIGVAASWLGLADLVLASDSAYLQIPFSALGLIPEVGTGVSFTQIMGPRIATEVLLLGRKLSVDDMLKYNFVNQVGCCSLVLCRRCELTPNHYPFRSSRLPPSNKTTAPTFSTRSPKTTTLPSSRARR